MECTGSPRLMKLPRGKAPSSWGEITPKLEGFKNAKNRGRPCGAIKAGRCCEMAQVCERMQSRGRTKLTNVSFDQTSTRPPEVLADV